jgi:DNA-binding NarL/FixJ family response regulator
MSDYTARERKIVELFKQGLSHEQIAERLSTAARPMIAAFVKTYLRSAAEKRGMSRVTFEASLRNGKA